MKRNVFKRILSVAIMSVMAIIPVMMTATYAHAETVPAPDYRTVTKSDGTTITCGFCPLGDEGDEFCLLPRYEGKDLHEGDMPALNSIKYDTVYYVDGVMEYQPSYDTDYLGSIQLMIAMDPSCNNGDHSDGEVYIEGSPAVAGINTYYLDFIDTPQNGAEPQVNRFPFTVNIKTQTVYRLYNSHTGEHLFTPDVNEKNTLIASYGWTSENKGWIAPSATADNVSITPVYRLYNPTLHNHLYTSDTNEVHVLTTSGGWVMDNGGQPLFYSGGSESIYRLYNRDANGLHLLTTDSNEYNVLPSQDNSWSGEGEKLKCISIN